MALFFIQTHLENQQSTSRSPRILKFSTKKKKNGFKSIVCRRNLLIFSPTNMTVISNLKLKQLKKMWNQFQDTQNVRRPPRQGQACVTTEINDGYILLIAHETEQAILLSYKRSCSWPQDEGCQAKQSKISFIKVVSMHVSCKQMACIPFTSSVGSKGGRQLNIQIIINMVGVQYSVQMSPYLLLICHSTCFDMERKEYS